MGKLNIFEISFSNLSGIYYAGDVLKGHVTVELKESMKMRGIRLKFLGNAEVSWSETQTSGSGDNETTTTYTYSNSEKYFDQEILLLGIWPKQGNETIELSHGRHSFPFEYHLPTGLPSSFEDSVGHVRYTATCNIDKPWKFDPKTKKPFTIIGVLDLNYQENAMQRLHGTNQKKLCCLCCASGPIEATFAIDRQGYVPGEAVLLNAEITNGSSRKIAKTYVELTMIKKFHATTKSRTDCTQVARVTHPGIGSHSSDVWSCEKVVIPSVPPSFLNGCKIIDIHYELKLVVDPKGPSFKLEVPLNIIIGTIPLASVIQSNPPMYPAFPDSTQIYLPNMYPSASQPDVFYPPAPVTGIPNLPPPSYNEAITGSYSIKAKDDTEHTRGDMKYTPVYTYYNWGHTPGQLPS
ncbi:unnamed protein product [Lymnaea stagnalis]|uniref:Arrestin C-terminal-like domain-containing protein n=1 Tax=Lymnaea stagnalis TaxID=6523 RepID=A0AAV2I508_LYMST